MKIVRLVKAFMGKPTESLPTLQICAMKYIKEMLYFMARNHQGGIAG
tara:strand:+ start:264 stop:404 length:141 start_codon:yes stop_codon:yes gene_type:complete